MDGIYAAFLAGQAGVSLALFLIKNDVLVGADVGGLKYDGRIERRENGFHCSVVYIIPPGATLITGASPPSEPMRVPITFELPANFTEGAAVRIETPLGPVNARFERLRDLTP